RRTGWPRPTLWRRWWKSSGRARAGCSPWTTRRSACAPTTSPGCVSRRAWRESSPAPCSALEVVVAGLAGAADAVDHHRGGGAIRGAGRQGGVDGGAQVAGMADEALVVLGRQEGRLQVVAQLADGLQARHQVA